MSWVRAVSVAAVKESGRILFRDGKRQLVLFAVGERFFAVDNRCPHEGYPLIQGAVDPETCQLTCQWHNWKFALDTGACVLGEDHVRSFPVRVDDGWLHVDVTDVPADEYRDGVLAGVIEAVDDRQYSRIAREVSRLLLRGLDPLDAVRATVEHTYDRFEYGTTHALGGAADWVALYFREDAPERKVLCLTETIDHMSYDALRHPRYPFPDDALRFDGAALLDAIEAESPDEATRIARDEPWSELEPWLARAALDHYNDFGHAVIYTYKAGSLLRALGDDLTNAIALPLTRKLCYSTREDLLPDFRGYGDQLSAVPKLSGASTRPLEPPFGTSTNQALAWVVDQLHVSAPATIHAALLEASALNLLHFEARYDRASRRSVSQNVGWLDFSHAITFANAGRVLAERYPELWPRVLLQMACFLGRNKRFVDRDSSASEWVVDDIDAFFDDALSAVLDHGRREPIFSVHLVKTLLATEQEVAHSSPSAKRALAAALNRFLNAPMKEKHPLRTARQALALAEASI